MINSNGFWLTLDRAWHLIFGGDDNPNEEHMKSVELFNWKTGENRDKRTNFGHEPSDLITKVINK